MRGKQERGFEGGTRKGRENEETVESDITRKRKLCACVKLE